MGTQATPTGLRYLWFMDMKNAARKRGPRALLGTPFPPALALGINEEETRISPLRHEQYTRSTSPHSTARHSPLQEIYTPPKTIKKDTHTLLNDFLLCYVFFVLF